MKSSDKALLGIVVGIIILIVTALIVTLTQPEPAYQSADDPEGVVNNYILALQKEDYKKAYEYLSPTLRGYPTSVDDFQETVLDRSWQFRFETDTALSVESVKIAGNRATATIHETSFRGGNIFNSYQSTSTFDIELHLINSGWKIIDSYRFFAWCWNDLDGCD